MRPLANWTLLLQSKCLWITRPITFKRYTRVLLWPKLHFIKTSSSNSITYNLRTPLHPCQHTFLCICAFNTFSSCHYIFTHSKPTSKSPLSMEPLLILPFGINHFLLWLIQLSVILCVSPGRTWAYWVQEYCLACLSLHYNKHKISLNKFYWIRWLNLIDCPHFSNRW